MLLVQAKPNKAVEYALDLWPAGYPWLRLPTLPETLGTWMKEGEISSMKITKGAEWAAIIGLVVSVAVLAFSGFRYVQIEETKQRQQSFSNYHYLIKEFGGGNKESITAAVVFELRNYPEYCDLSLRLLQHFEPEWPEGVAKKEMKKTLSHLQGSCSGS